MCKFKSLLADLFFVFAAVCCHDAFADENRWASPTILVDVLIEESEGGQMLSGVHYYQEVFSSSFHHESNIGLTDRINLTQQIVAMASEVRQYKTQLLHFIEPNGQDLQFDAVAERLKKNAVVYVLPAGATLHPSIKSTLRPDVIIAIQKSARRLPVVVLQRPTIPSRNAIESEQ